MKFKFVCAICVYLFFGKVFSQSTEMEKVLSQIEQNNKELKAYQSYINGQQLQVVHIIPICWSIDAPIQLRILAALRELC